MTGTPDGIIGLELDGQGFDKANRDLDKMATGWERIGQHAERAFGYVDRMAGRVAGIAGVAGIGVLINDLMKIEDVASRAALSVNQATGRQGWMPYQGAILGAATATSTDPAQLGGAMASMQMRVGGTYLNKPGAWGTLGRAIGDNSKAFGIEVPQLGSYLETFGIYGNRGAGGMPALLDRIAGQARAGGREGQTGQWMQAMAQMTAQLGSLHGLPTMDIRGLGAMYGAAGQQNSIFRDPGMFAAGALGLDQSLTHAYANPRLQASLQMAGVGYKMQREGLGGKHGQEMARRVLDYSERQYGKGTTEQDLFLRSQFGDVSASMLEALGDGRKTWKELQRPGQEAGQHARTRRRSLSDQQTLRNNAQKQENRALDAADGGIEALLEKLGVPSLEDAAVLLGGGMVGKRLLRKGIRRLMRRGGAKAGEAAAEAAHEAVVAAESGAESAAAAGGRGLLGKGLRLGGKALGRAAIPAAIAEALIDADSTWAGEDAWVWKQKKATMSKRFGARWNSDPRAREWAIKNFGLHSYNEHTQLGKAFGKAFAPARALMRGDGNDAERFARAVDKFERIVQGAGGPTNKKASYDGGSNAAGLQDANSVTGSNMVLASMLTGGGSGGSGSSAQTALASYRPDVGGTGAGGGGGGWKTCTMTWYDPALGGTNSGNGAKDPHHAMANGQPYSASAHTCAAPKGYDFGTQIAFSLGGKTVTCTVTDRGGGINGSHFDLSRGAAEKIGLIRAGRATGKFKVVGKSAATGKGGGQSSGGGGQSSGGAGGAQMASWSGAAPASPQAAWGGGGAGGGGGGNIVVQVDGREVTRTRRLTRGRA